MFIGDARKQLFSMLASLGKGTAITDSSGGRDCLHMELPTPEVFNRFLGNGSDFLAFDQSGIDDWVVTIKQWLDHGLQKVYFFLHQHDGSDTPLIADYTTQAFNKYLRSNLSRVKFMTKDSQ